MTIEVQLLSFQELSRGVISNLLEVILGPISNFLQTIGGSIQEETSDMWCTDLKWVYVIFMILNEF